MVMHPAMIKEFNMNRRNGTALEKELVAELGCVQFINVAVDQRRVHHLLKLVLGGKDRSLAGHDLLFQLQKLLF